MLKVLASATLVLVLEVFALAQVDDPSGRWKATLARGDRTGVAVMTLKVEGTQVIGTLSEPSGQTLEIENGKLEEGRLTFDASASEHGGTKNIHFFGQVTAGEITLHNESDGNQGMTMTFHRVQE
jgi:uncharacterized protein involved in outer membrane biogenesis